MKLDIYQEQYKSPQARANIPNKIGTDTGIKALDLASTAIKATESLLAQKDSFDFTRVYADTVMAAGQLQQDYKANANPETFLEDMDGQKQTIQKLISDSAKQFKTNKVRNAFIQKATTGIEVPYMGDSLQYSYNLQENHYKNKLEEQDDQLKAILLEGSSYMSVEDALKLRRETAASLASFYHIPQDKLENYQQAGDTSFVSAYAYGTVKKNPYIVKELLVGKGLEAFRAFKEASGEGFTTEEFLQNEDLRKEYSNSEFGAKFTNLVNHLDYATRLDLLSTANSEIDNLEKEKQKLSMMEIAGEANKVAEDREACLSAINTTGSIQSQFKGVVTIDHTIDPRLGEKSKPIRLGKISYGNIDKSKGNKILPYADTFAKGIAGTIGQLGYKTSLNSNLRPKDTGSQHATGKAADIQVFKDGKVSVPGLVKAYEAALDNYSNNLRKKGTIFEINPKMLDYVKQTLQKDGYDISYVNWEDSKTYGASAHAENREHLHFGIDNTADYSKTNSGKAVQFKLKTQYGKKKYIQLMHEGKDPVECFNAAQKDEIEFDKAALQYKAVNNLVTITGKNGKPMNPAYYGEAINAQEQYLIANKNKMSSTEYNNRVIALNAMKEQAPKLQQAYKDNPVQFMFDTRQAKNMSEAITAQMQLYGVSPENVVSMTEDEAKVKADQLYSKFSGDEAVKYLSQVNTATLKQLANYLPEGIAKSNMLLYSKAANPALRGDIVGALQNWDTVKTVIEQNKNKFPTNWQATAIAEFSKNKTVKTYFDSLARVAPGEKTKMLDAMTSIYAYKLAYNENGADKDKIINSIVKGLISDNVTSVTVANPRLGNTQISVATNIIKNSKDVSKITRVGSVAAKLGLKEDRILTGYTPSPVTVKSPGIKSQLTAAQEIWKNTYLKAVQNTLGLSSTPDGLNAVFTQSTSKGGYGDFTVKDSKTGSSFKIPFKDMMNIYDEAAALVKQDPHFRDKVVFTQQTGLSLKHDYKPNYAKTLAKVAINQGVLGPGPTAMKELATAQNLNIELEQAMTQQIQKILVNKYPWLNAPKSSLTGGAANIYGFPYKGNINLTNRPVVKNTNGSISTVRSISYTAKVDGKDKVVLIPTISNEGDVLSNKEAVTYWKNKNQNLGIYDTIEEANKAAKQIHDQQQAYYTKEDYDL